MRKESDFFGELEIPADKLYGVQTQRALLNFPIGSDQIEKLPVSLNNVRVFTHIFMYIFVLVCINARFDN